MTKGKRPHRKDSVRDDEAQPRTEEKADLVPPAHVALEHHPPTLSSLLETVRGAVGALMGWADAAADVINKTLQRRA